MIAMDREDWNGNIDIGIFVVDMIECSVTLLATFLRFL